MHDAVAFRLALRGVVKSAANEKGVPPVWPRCRGAFGGLLVTPHRPARTSDVS
jgi:hypothetical protein